MTEDDGDSLEVRFLKANANKEYMAGVLADCIRNCMRGVAAGEPSSAAYKASQDFLSLIKLLKYAETGVPLMQLFVDAIDEIRPTRTDDIGNAETFAERYFESSILSSAQSGIQFIIERSCHDGAAKGRASRRESDFLSSLRRIEEARTEMNKNREKRWANQSPASRIAKKRTLAATGEGGAARSAQVRGKNKRGS